MVSTLEIVKYFIFDISLLSLKFSIQKPSYTKYKSNELKTFRSFKKVLKSLERFLKVLGNHK